MRSLIFFLFLSISFDLLASSLVDEGISRTGAVGG